MNPGLWDRNIVEIICVGFNIKWMVITLRKLFYPCYSLENWCGNGMNKHHKIYAIHIFCELLLCSNISGSGYGKRKRKSSTWSLIARSLTGKEGGQVLSISGRCKHGRYKHDTLWVSTHSNRCWPRGFPINAQTFLHKCWGNCLPIVYAYGFSTKSFGS